MRVKSRSEAVDFIAKQFMENAWADNTKHNKYHYGAIELRRLMDFIYQGAPSSDDERIGSVSSGADSRRQGEEREAAYRAARARRMEKQI